MIRLALFLLLTLCTTLTLGTKCEDPTKCSETETCCQIGEHSYGCCPVPNAVCCADQMHCCPHGMQCDTTSDRCLPNYKDFFSHRKTRLNDKHHRNEFNEVICPDKASKCPDDSTCCLLEQGSYGCCPAPKAVCCPDLLHCCPHGFTCHGQFCKKDSLFVPRLRKFPATPIRHKPAISFMDENEIIDKEFTPIACGEDTTCPAGSTCCRNKDEFGLIRYMCCPLTNGVCCRNTCCPSGYHCVKNGKCEKAAHGL